MNTYQDNARKAVDVQAIARKDLAKISGGGPIFCYKNPKEKGNPTRLVFGGEDYIGSTISSDSLSPFALIQEWTKSDGYVTKTQSRFFFRGEFKAFCKRKGYNYF